MIPTVFDTLLHYHHALRMDEDNLKSDHKNNASLEDKTMKMMILMMTEHNIINHRVNVPFAQLKGSFTFNKTLLRVIFIYNNLRTR